MVIAAIPLGLAIGLAFGTLGGGGSVLAIPVLVYVLGESVHSATTASLVIVAVAALAGGLGHSRGGRVCWRHALAFAGPAVAGVLVGTEANQRVGGSLLLALFVPVMLAGAWATWRKAADGDDGEDLAPRVCPPLWIRRDAVAGIGGGFVVVPMLVIVLGFSMRSAVGTSLVIVSAVSLVALAAHLGAGNSLDLGVTAAMTAACVAGAVAGGHLAARFSHQILARGFTLLVTGVAVYLLIATTFLGGAPSG
jgi:uncharacterized membrane protein YfcA